MSKIKFFLTYIIIILILIQQNIVYAYDKRNLQSDVSGKCHA